MIHRISSSLTTFKPLKFGPGLNILVADKTEQSTSRNTRNGAGKSSLIEVINFVFGSTADSDSVFRTSDLAPHFFSVEFDLNDRTLRASRKGEQHNRIYLDGLGIETWVPGLELDEDLGKSYVNNSKWREILGNAYFNLDREISGSAKKNRPSFRSLFSYFVRRHADAGFHEAKKHFKNQATADYQVNLSYLFGLDWSIAQEWQKIRDQEKSIDALRTALRQGELGGELIESSGKLRTQLTLAEKERDDLRERLSSFRIIEDHTRLEEEASDLTNQINRLADDNSSDSLIIRELEESLDQEKPPSAEDLLTVYKQAGVDLPGITLQRFEAVQAFHQSVIQNRRTYLLSEIDAAKDRIASRRLRQNDMDLRRSRVMQILQSSGALQQYSLMQSELARLESDVATLLSKYEMARQLESRKSELTIKREKLANQLRANLEDSRESVRQAILTFEGISEELYDNPGSLTIEATENGPEFGTEIHAKRSVGKNSMQIFCFDVTLSILNSGERMPGFLIHDSHLFDGADERQIAKALAIGAQSAEQHRFQYIVTMNSDDLPRREEFPKSFSLENYINSVKLTDATEDGGLFGFRFG
jgi:uncharacterized protein YydD (DUF2326 family)